MKNITKLNRQHKEYLASKYVSMKNKIENVLICEEGNGGFDDGGSVSYLKGTVIGVILTGLVLVLVKAFLPEFFDMMKTKLSEILK